MKDKDTQLIWEAYLVEAAPPADPAAEAPADPAAGAATAGLVNINAGPGEVLAVVPKLLKDPKLRAILLAGQTDAGGPEDEIINIQLEPRGRVASELMPTQSQIGASQSLNDQASDKFGNLDRAIAGGALASKQGEFPILVFGNYVLDGHHRWSQFIATNPNAQVDVANIVAPGVTDEKGALGLLHYMNFALFGKSPVKDFDGANLYEMDRDQIYQQAMSVMADSAVQKLYAAQRIEEPTREAAAHMFANNLENLPGPGQYPRLQMPQPGDAGSEDGYATTPDKAAAGDINYLAPQASDVGASPDDAV